MLFSDRAQAAIKHAPPLPIRKGQGSEEPDRVYGLQDAGSLRRVLNSTGKHAANAGTIQPLRESIEVTPFEDEGERLLFPFLIMEAKSSKQGDAAAVEMQTAFCIQRLLKLQHELRRSTEDSSGAFEPLVWFVSWFGERWNVAGCFVNDTRTPVEWVRVLILRPNSLTLTSDNRKSMEWGYNGPGRLAPAASDYGLHIRLGSRCLSAVFAVPAQHSVNGRHQRNWPGDIVKY